MSLEDHHWILGAQSVEDEDQSALELPLCHLPTEGDELGRNLLNRCASRDRFPIPSLLVISAHRLQRIECFAMQAAEKVVYFVIPSEARNLSLI
jgi:hypothetical protein